MADDDKSGIELTILLEIVRYLNLRERKSGAGEGSQILAAALAALPNGTSIGSLISSVINLSEETVVGDKYEFGQAGSVGPHSVAIGQQFQQVWNKSGDNIDLPSLVAELGRLRDSARLAVTGDPAEDIAMAELAQAQVAATEGDGPKTLSHLARAGQWALNVAQQIGVPIATEALRAALGI